MRELLLISQEVPEGLLNLHISAREKHFVGLRASVAVELGHVLQGLKAIILSLLIFILNIPECHLAP
jgi:hypothetical protein